MNQQIEQSRKRSFYFSKAFLSACAFCLGLTVLEMIFLPQFAEFEVLSKHFASGNYLRLFVVSVISAFSIVLTLLFFYAAFSSYLRWRFFYFLFFSLATLIEYGYYKAFSRFSGFQDFEIAFFSTNWQILSNAGAMYSNGAALIPILIFGLLLMTTKDFRQKGLATFAGLFILIGLFFGVTGYFTRNLFPTNSFAADCRTFVKFPMAWFLGSYNEPPRISSYMAVRRKIDFRASAPPSNNIIFIVDESVRGDHLSLNGYAKPTTPFLEDLSRRGFIRNWGVAASGTTCSGTSNNLLLTGLTNLPDTNFDVYKLPTIFQYARAMKYKTYYFDGQVSGLWNGKPSDIPDFGEWIKESELSGKVNNKYEIDGEIGRRIKEITDKSSGNFIWVNKYGVHKPYTNSYPNSDENARDFYKFIYNSEIDKETLKNQYDEAITYNSQLFFSEILGAQPAQNTIYIYTSDHGQTLSQNGETFSHCSNTKTEAIVPLFIIAAPENFPAAETNFKASHSNIFATILDFMNFPENERKYNYAPSLLKVEAADSKPRFYFSGDLQGRDQGDKYPFD